MNEPLLCIADRELNLVKTSVTDRKMRDYKRTLMIAFPPDSGGTVEAQGKGRGGRGRQRSWGTAKTSKGRVSMAKMWKSFVSTPQQPAPPADMECLSRRQHFSNMVEQ